MLQIYTTNSNYKFKNLCTVKLVRIYKCGSKAKMLNTCSVTCCETSYKQKGQI